MRRCLHHSELGQNLSPNVVVATERGDGLLLVLHILLCGRWCHQLESPPRNARAAHASKNQSIPGRLSRSCRRRPGALASRAKPRLGEASSGWCRPRRGREGTSPARRPGTSDRIPYHTQTPRPYLQCDGVVVTGLAHTRRLQGESRTAEGSHVRVATRNLHDACAAQ
jgi:hypothetical protein